MTFFLGIDVGSVTTKAAIIDENNKVVAGAYTKTEGSPVQAVQKVLKNISAQNNLHWNRQVSRKRNHRSQQESDKRDLSMNKYCDASFKEFKIMAVGTTGSGRELARILVGGDIAKNEITAHAAAALEFYPDARTIFEIGGQDSKVILLRKSVVVDFAMNSVCAAGTGSFLDQQANRLGIPIQDFGAHALKSKQEVNIAGRCGIFAESDMIHKQQLGFKKEDLINGLCHALARNYLNNICKGKQLEEPILFQGGVAANVGLKKAFEDQLGKKLIVPEHHSIMGAIGAAIIAKKNMWNNSNTRKKTGFLGFALAEKEFVNKSFTCNGCSNHCEVTQIFCKGKRVACLGDKCGKWSN